jgi:prophage regulatory protein
MSTRDAGKVLRLDAVAAMVGLARSTIRAKAKTGEFPAPVRLGKRAVGWPEATVVRWLRARPLQGADSH